MRGPDLLWLRGNRKRVPRFSCEVSLKEPGKERKAARIGEHAELGPINKLGLFMVSKSIFKPILDNEALTRGLGDPEARVLVEWLVAEAERLMEEIRCPQTVTGLVRKLCRRARAVSRFVGLWANPTSRGAACQLAATERFGWPLPTSDVDPCELMLDILSYEGEANESAGSRYLFMTCPHSSLQQPKKRP